jgi:hypothetical protein
MLSVVMPSVVMLNFANKPFLLSAIMLNVVMPSVVMLNVVAPNIGLSY